MHLVSLVLYKMHYVCINVCFFSFLKMDFFCFLSLCVLCQTGLPRCLENQENLGKSGNLKINQKIKEKSGNFIKLTDWQSPYELTSCQFQKQNVYNSGLESHTCDFFANLRKCVIYLCFILWKSMYRSSYYCWIPQSLKFLISKFCKNFGLPVSKFLDFFI